MGQEDVAVLVLEFGSRNRTVRISIEPSRRVNVVVVSWKGRDESEGDGGDGGAGADGAVTVRLTGSRG